MFRIRIRVAFLVLIFYVVTAQACMPGYEAEREKLRQYLGIEWIQSGLKAMDAQKPKPIRHPSELNCDFSEPKNCRWMNDNNLDTLNFHLFEKTDHTVFPVLQVRPGPSKLDPGDKLIFVGDRKKNDQSALLTSWPIRCQNTTGKLTLNFWVFNGAMVEAIILEEDTESGTLHQSGEKIYIDCGTVTLNTECTAEIPPRSTPFKIGLRAFDIKHPEGSFVMIDNIFYDAQLCKVAIDLGPDFKSESLVTGAEGMPINMASELNCYEFDKGCRWRNGGHGSRIWKRALSAPSEQLMFNETGTYTVPKGPYAFMYIEGESKPNDFMALISDPVDCQSSSESIISFRLWATKGVNVSVCTVNFDMKPLECQHVTMGRSPAPSIHRFAHVNKFMYAFIIDSANPDYDTFVMIDDINYEATLCNEAVNVLDFGKNFYATPMLSVLLNRPIQSSDDLKCNFSKRGLDCLWANLDGEKVQWEVGLGTIDKTKFSTLTRRLNVPDSEFAIARLEHPNMTTSLASETIKCLKDRAALSFRYWNTGSATLSVCIVKSISFEVIDCTDVERVTTDTIFIDIPQLREPIRIVLRVNSNDGKGIIAVDDIKLEGKLCSSLALSGNSGYGKTKSKRPTGYDLSATPDTNVCRLLTCNFDRQHLCLYESIRVSNSLSMFTVRNGSAFTMLFERSKVAMLESSTFKLNSPARFHFDYSIDRGMVQIFICEDSVNRELDSCYKVTNAKNSTKTFVHDYIEVLPSDTKVYIIVKLDQSSKKANVRIDNIVLTDVNNHEVC